MEMFLVGLCLSVFGLAVSAIAFGAATRDEREQVKPGVQPELKPALKLPAPRFFVDAPALLDSPAIAMPRTQVPIEVLLLQIERHVRLEQAAAESFHEYPTTESLHSRTASPLVH